MALSDQQAGFAACIPTQDRPDAVRGLLTSLLEQDQRFDVVLVIDASATKATERICEEFEEPFGRDVLRYERSASGLTLERLRGLEILRQLPDIRYIAFFDDDVVLDPPFLSAIGGFMESDAGRAYGGVSGYDKAGWGKPFSRLERLYNKLGLFEGELMPGRWLYCGHFLEFEQLSDTTPGVYDCEFLPGPFNVWRVEVFDEFLPPTEMAGYALGEDKHLSLRARTRYRLAVHCDARARHLHAEGGRPKRLNMAFRHVRMGARLIRDCDPARASRRYVAFLGFNLINCAVQFLWRIGRGQFRDVGTAFASAAGVLSCVIAPPRRTRDALTALGGSSDDG